MDQLEKKLSQIDLKHYDNNLISLLREILRRLEKLERNAKTASS